MSSPINSSTGVKRTHNEISQAEIGNGVAPGLPAFGNPRPPAQIQFPMPAPSIIPNSEIYDRLSRLEVRVMTLQGKLDTSEQVNQAQSRIIEEQSQKIQRLEATVRTIQEAKVVQQAIPAPAPAQPPHVQNRPPQLQQQQQHQQLQQHLQQQQQQQLQPQQQFQILQQQQQQQRQQQQQQLQPQQQWQMLQQQQQQPQVQRAPTGFGLDFVKRIPIDRKRLDNGLEKRTYTSGEQLTGTFTTENGKEICTNGKLTQVGGMTLECVRFVNGLASGHVIERTPDGNINHTYISSVVDGKSVRTNLVHHHTFAMQAPAPFVPLAAAAAQPAPAPQAAAAVKQSLPHTLGKVVDLVPLRGGKESRTYSDGGQLTGVFTEENGKEICTDGKLLSPSGKILECARFEQGRPIGEVTIRANNGEKVATCICSVVDGRQTRSQLMVFKSPLN